MSKTTVTVNSPQIGFLGLLAIVFIVLKLINKISWSWFWVLSPIWIPFAIFILIIAIPFMIIGISLIFDKIRSKIKGGK